MGHVIQANMVLWNCCRDSDEETFRERVISVRIERLRGKDRREIKVMGARVRCYGVGKTGLRKSLHKASSRRPTHGFHMDIGKYVH